MQLGVLGEICLETDLTKDDPVADSQNTVQEDVDAPGALVYRL
jgi:hypothetical protein